MSAIARRTEDVMKLAALLDTTKTRTLEDLLASMADTLKAMTPQTRSEERTKALVHLAATALAMAGGAS